MSLRVALLGPVEASVDGAAVPLGGPLPRGALALLALAAPEAVPADELATGLWGEAPPATARATLRAYLSRLRAALDPDRLQRTAAGYRLEVDEVDARRFADEVESARAALEARDPQVAASRLRAALARWRGPALADLLDLPFAAGHAARLEQGRLQARELLGEALLAAAARPDGGAAGAAVEHLQALVDEAPLRERATALLMSALYRGGRQADALAAYQRLRAALVDELGVEPGPEVRALHQRVLAQDPALLGTPAVTALPGPAPPGPAPPGPAPPGPGPHGPVQPGPAPAPAAGNLPAPLTSFVGRRAELATVRELLDAGRMVTLTGAGGCGKTRLALEVARRAGGALGEPWLVELAGLAERRLVDVAVAEALGVVVMSGQPPADVLAAALAPRQVLLVLDNCEHVVEDAAALAEQLLQRCPGVRVLATSREPLGVPGERIFVVPSLEVTSGKGPGDAVRLFAERAADVDPGFALDEGTTPAVHRICAELDGIPLAIELAAARLSVLSPQQVADMLDDRFALLTSGSRTALPRHRTLHAAVAWSFDLLEDDERALLEAASVFRDGFELSSLAAVAGDVASVDVLARLVAKSMVVVDAGATPRRYRLLETLRDFADRQLEGRRRTALADAHAAWCAALVEEAHGHLRGPQAGPWWRRLAVEHHNLHAGLRHALARGQAEVALRIAGPLSWYWYRHGPVPQGRRWLDEVLAAAEAPMVGAAAGGPVPGPVQARAHVGKALLAYLAGDLGETQEELHRALERNGPDGDPAVGAVAELYLAFFESLGGALEAAEARLERAAQLATRAPPWVQPEVAMTRGQLARIQGRTGEAVRHLTEGRQQALAVGHTWGAGSCAWIAAKALLDDGRPAEAAALLAEAIAGYAHDRTSLLVTLHTLAPAVAGLGRSREAAVLLGAVDALGERIGFSPLQMDPEAPRHRQVALSRLGPEVAADAMAQGRTLDVAAATALALRLAREVGRTRRPG